MADIHRAALGTTPPGTSAGLGGGTATPSSSGGTLQRASQQDATPSPVDPLDALAAAARDLLTRVDRAIEQLGAPPGHPVCRLLTQLGVPPGQAFALFASAPLAPLKTLAAELRAIAKAYRDELAEPLNRASKRLGWSGAGYDAFVHHWQNLMDHLAGQFPEGASMVDRLDISASYVEALATWYASGRNALVHVLVQVLPSREAATLRACTALSDTASHTVPTNSSAVAAAAAEIAYRVLSAVAEVYDEGVDTFLPGPHSSPEAARWAEYLPVLPYRSAPAPRSSASSTDLWIRL